MKLFQAMALTLTCLLFTIIAAVSSTQAAIISGDIHNGNIKEYHRQLKKKCKDKKGKFKVKGMSKKINCRKLAEKNLCNKKYKKGKKKKIFDKCPISCEIFCEETMMPSEVPTDSPTATTFPSIVPSSTEEPLSEMPNVGEVPTDSPTATIFPSIFPSSTEEPLSESPFSTFPPSTENESCLIRHVDILSALDNAFGAENCSDETEMMTSDYLTGSMDDLTPMLTYTTSCSVCPSPGYFTTKMTYVANIVDVDSDDDPCPFHFEYYSTYVHMSYWEIGYLNEGGEDADIFNALSYVKNQVENPPISPSEMPSSYSFSCYV